MKTILIKNDQLKNRYIVQNRDNGITIKKQVAAKYENYNGYCVLQVSVKRFNSTKEITKNNIQDFYNNNGTLIMFNKRYYNNEELDKII